MEEFPLNEELYWGDGEDVEWSLRVREKYDFTMNVFSEVKLLKQQSNHDFSECNNDIIEILNEKNKNI